MFCQLNMITKKGPNAKMRKKCKKISNIEKIFLARFAHSAFYKIHISGADNRHAPVQYAKYDCFFFFLFLFFFFLFLSSHHDTTPLFHLYHFRKKSIIIYWLILTVNHQGSYFSVFCLHPVGQTFLYPSKFCSHLKHSAK